jgi:hypothetical protein
MPSGSERLETRFFALRENLVSHPEAAMRKIVFRADHYYHLYNRGVNRQLFFSRQRTGAFLLEACTNTVNLT